VCLSLESSRRQRNEEKTLEEGRCRSEDIDTAGAGGQERSACWRRVSQTRLVRWNSGPNPVRTDGYVVISLAVSEITGK
jgi:hypothetical protein